MPPPPDLPKYCRSYRRRGKLYVYYRRGGQQFRIKEKIGSAAFHRAYASIHEAFEQANMKDPAPSAGSLKAMIVAFQSSPEWTRLGELTKRDYSSHFDALIEHFGHLPVATLPTSAVIKMRDNLAATPRKANYRLQVLSRLMSWGIPRDWRPDRTNPVRGIEKLRTGPGYRHWDDDELAWFLGCASPMAATAAALGAFSAQRGGDVIGMTWHDYDGTGIKVVQEKTGAQVWIPVHPTLQRVLSKVPRTAITILTNESGQPFTTDWFKTWFGNEVRRCGLEGLSFHGLRKTATRRLIEAGCSEDEAMSITGQTTTTALKIYKQGIRQRELAVSAMAKLERALNESGGKSG